MRYYFNTLFPSCQWEKTGDGLNRRTTSVRKIAFKKKG